jgi:hypothetical protein
MALDYTQTFELLKDVTFVGRVQIACMHFADYIEGEVDTTPAHNTRLRWAQATFADAAGQAQQLMPLVVIDTQVQTDGATISDANLQTVVETAANKLF